MSENKQKKVVFLIIEPETYEFKSKENLLRSKAKNHGFEIVDFVYLQNLSEQVSETLTANFENMKEKIFEMVEKKYSLVFTVGGIGLDKDDFVPEATLAITDRRLYGMERALFNFMEDISEKFIFQRPVIAVRRKSIIMNLPEEFEHIERILDFFLPKFERFFDDLMKK